MRLFSRKYPRSLNSIIQLSLFCLIPGLTAGMPGQSLAPALTPAQKAKAVVAPKNSSPGDVDTHANLLKVNPYRVMIGLDVSAASSADPAAKFLGEADIDLPLPVTTKSDVHAPVWIFGDARISSIQQPGAISGLSNPTSYVSALTAAPPNNIVQSFEATIGFEVKLQNKNFALNGNQITVSWISDAGLITPVSVAQNGIPTVYNVTSGLYNYYTGLAQENPGNVIYQENSASIQTACPAATTTTVPTCYLAQYPVARSRFYRNYATGFRIKTFIPDTDINHSGYYQYPAIFDLTIGQNEFVSGGILRHLVAHVGGSTPIPLVPGLFAYASFDLEATTGNPVNKQFVLNAAAPTITPSSPNVAGIFVQQPDSDRYRFGVAYNLRPLASALASAIDTYIKNLGKPPVPQ